MIRPDLDAHLDEMLGPDPLAELAKLIGGNDPYARLMPEERRAAINDIIYTDGPFFGQSDSDMLNWSVMRLCPNPVYDAIFYPGSVLAGYEHELPDLSDEGPRLIRDYADPTRDAFFYRPHVKQFHAAMN